MTNTCPLCQAPLVVQSGAKPLGERVESHADCWEACPRCGIALSNATGATRTFIRKDWMDGLWRRSTSARLETVLACSLNKRSRAKKKRRLAHERSEDLLTWNAFSWLEDCGLLGQLFTILGRAGSSGVQVFYWGANDRYALPLDLSGLLIQQFGESPQSLSEPDIILIGQKDVVFIEAKFGSPNECIENDPRVDKYVNAMPAWFADPAVVRAAGYYELTRNWAIGAAVATALGRNFTLVNLVREGDEHGVVARFGRVVTRNGAFERRIWEVLAGVDPLMVPCLRRQTLYFQPAFPALCEDTVR